jgi:CBS domain-containing protein
MLVREIMTEQPVSCRTEQSVQEAARMMVQCDCGQIPVIDDSGKPVGVITDRDITCRVVAEGKGGDTKVQEAMTTPVVTVSDFADVAECCELMEQKMIRRVVVVDQNGTCCGIVSQGDIALQAPGFAEEIVAEVSAPTQSASGVE